MGLIQKIKTQKFTWVNITNPNSASIEYLRQNFDFHPLDLDDCLNETLRAKLDEYDNYLFMVMNLPIFDRKTRVISLSEVDIFIGRDYLITINSGKLEPLKNMFESCQIDESERNKYLSDDVTFLIYNILNNFQKYCFPILNHISKDLEDVENQIFSHQEKKMVREILIIKRNITNFRRSVESHKNVIKKIGDMGHKDFMKNDLQIYFKNTLEQSKEIWESLENLKETVDVLHSTNESLISFKLNSIMKTLTIISVLIFPANLVSSIFGMNYNIPFQNSPFGFYGAILLIMIGMTILYLTFKKKNYTK
ncbi:MAG: magnesium transporter CorA family protein [Patescibacteria group bacterium]|nr:magnesium transporter CorA family protein [Patescibacteria group bacterium]